MAERGVKSDHAPMDHWVSFPAPSVPIMVKGEGTTSGPEPLTATSCVTEIGDDRVRPSHPETGIGPSTNR